MFADILIFVALYAACATVVLGQRSPDAGDDPRRPPLVTSAVFLATAVPSLLQGPVPSVLAALDRNAVRLADGQVWRLVTPMLVQDGGWPGTAFNLVFLIVLGVLAEQVLGRRAWLLLYLGGGIAGEVIAYALLPQGFAGNSGGNMSLAAGLLIVAAWWPVNGRVRVVAFIGIAAGVLLLASGDLHGAIFAVAALLALVVIVRPGLRSPSHPR